MLRRPGMLTFALLALSLLHHSAYAGDLNVGDAAPALSVSKFVKGMPITSFEKGKIYVIEFWATWCGPCKASIPHITAMQTKYKDVVFIGVDVYESSPESVEPYVKSMGDKMAYRVALDYVPAGRKPEAGPMWVNWMLASRQPGIPAAFIVNRMGDVTWIGHPDSMEKPLAKVVSGKWDQKAAVIVGAREKAVNVAYMDLLDKIAACRTSKDYTGTLSAMNTAISEYPELDAKVCIDRFWFMSMCSTDSEAAAYGNKLLHRPLRDYPEVLNNIAWYAIFPGNSTTPGPKVIGVALKAALRADELSKGMNPAITDTLAQAYFAAGKRDLAISTEERALEHSTAPDDIADSEKSIERFKQQPNK